MFRRTIIYIVIFMVICLLLPILITKKEKVVVSKEVINMENEIVEEKEPAKYDYKEFNIIKLLHTSTSEIEELYLDDYMYCVLAAEMPANYEIEALKAQAVVARTYTIYNIKNVHKHIEADMCDNPSCCQAFITKEDRFSKWEKENCEYNWNKIVRAVDETAGKIITYNNEPINAFFHANSGGETEIVSNVWGGADYPYLQAVATGGEDAYKQYSSVVSLTKEELVEKLKQVHPEILINFNEENPIEIMEYTDSGRIKTIRFGNIELSGVETRSILGLKSAKFSVNIGENIVFNVMRIWAWCWDEPNRCR